MADAWTLGEIRWVVNNYKRFCIGELVEKHNEAFPGRIRTKRAIEGCLWKRNVYKNSIHSRYTKDELEFLVDNMALAPEDLGREYRLRFRIPRSNKSLVRKRCSLASGYAREVANG